MYNYNRRRNTNLWLIGLGAVIIALIICFWVYEVDIKTGHVTFTVQRLDDQSTGNGHKYLIFTDQGVYSDSDNWFHGKFASSDLYGQLQRGKSYNCTYTGFRVPLFSWYRNLVNCTPTN